MYQQKAKQTVNYSITAKQKLGTVDASMSENIYLISWTAPDDKGKYHLNIKITDDRGKVLKENYLFGWEYTLTQLILMKIFHRMKI